MLSVQLIRHARTAGNESGRYIGSTDEPLSPDGKAELGRWICAGAYRPVDAVFSSPMRRCLETASLIFADMCPQIVPKLAECRFGAFEGKTYEELRDDAVYRRWIASDGRSAVPGGEDSASFRSRCRKGFEQMVEMAFARGCGRVAAVVHGGSIMAILERFAPGAPDFYRWQVPNCSGFVVDVDAHVWRDRRQIGEPQKIMPVRADIC